MAQRVLFLGTNPNDGTGQNLRDAGGDINNNFTEIYALQSQTINAGAVEYNFTGATYEQRIALADADAVLRGFDLLYIPAFMLQGGYDIALCMPSAGIRRVREGSNFSWWDVTAYGCAGDLIRDDTTGAQAAITACAANLVAGIGGGVVYFPTGRYKTTADLVVPVVTQATIVLKGQGMRASWIYPSTPGQRGVLFGSTTPDASGTSTNNTQFCGMEDMSVNGSLLTSGTGIGVQMTQMQHGWMTNAQIENFDSGSSIGLLLQGSLTTGLDAAAPPHCWRNTFMNVNVVTSKRPLVLANADENAFFSCTFGLQLGMAAGGIAIEWVQGQHNRFYNLLLAGSVDLAFRPNYYGLKFDAPVNGSVRGLNIYGMWAEGFDKALLFGGGNGQDAWVRGYMGSTNRVEYDNGSENGTGTEERHNNVHIEIAASSQAGGVRDYHSGPNTASRPVQLTQNSTTPSVAGSSVFTCNNTNPTTITAFTDGQQGAPITVRLDANTTIQHGTGANNIRCPGAANITAAANKVVTMVGIGGLWQVQGVSLNA